MIKLKIGDRQGSLIFKGRIPSIAYIWFCDCGKTYFSTSNTVRSCGCGKKELCNWDCK